MLRVAELQRFCMRDGPGLRTVVFLKGCPLRCAWCHNPETQERNAQLLFEPRKCVLCGACGACVLRAHRFPAEGEHLLDRAACTACGLCAQLCPTGALTLCGERRSAEELLAMIERDAAFYGREGGVTLSGGEPLLQIEGCLRLLRLCRERGIPTVVETCGCFDGAHLAELVPLVDLFLWDIKDTNSARHAAYTGVGNEKLVENLFAADRLGARIRLRCILVRGVNTEAAHYRKLAALRASLSGCVGVELIPYHAYGGSKATLLGRPDSGRREWIPEEEDLRLARAILGGNA